MVAYSNKYNLPSSYFNACVKINSQYTAGRSDYTGTQLAKPARQVILEKENADKIIKDVSELTWSVFGTIGHEIMENSTTHGITEKRFYSNYNGYVLGGQIDGIVPCGDDPYHVDVLDYKFVNTWSVRYDGIEKWEQQQNIYKDLLERNGYRVRHLQILAIFKNWSEKEKNQKKYPRREVMLYLLPVWEKGKAEELINEKIALLEEAKKELPLCTPEEQWRRGDTWAVVTEQGGRALSGGVCSSKEEAINVAQTKYSNMKNIGIEHRRAVAKNCESYCNAREFCTQYQKEKELGQSIYEPLTKKGEK